MSCRGAGSPRADGGESATTASARCANGCKAASTPRTRRSARLEERIVKGDAGLPLALSAGNAGRPTPAYEAAGEYRKMLYRLNSDDLPRFESAFKSLLNENTIREVANFQSQLNRERRNDSRADRNHQSLAARDRLQSRAATFNWRREPNPDPEIRDFLQRPARVHRRLAGGLRRGRTIRKRSSCR